MVDDHWHFLCDRSQIDPVCSDRWTGTQKWTGSAVTCDDMSMNTRCLKDVKIHIFESLQIYDEKKDKSHAGRAFVFKFPLTGIICL